MVISILIYFTKLCVFSCALQGKAVKLVLGCFNKMSFFFYFSYIVFFIIQSKDYQSNWCWFIHFMNGFYLFLQMKSSDTLLDFYHFWINVFLGMIHPTQWKSYWILIIWRFEKTNRSGSGSDVCIGSKRITAADFLMYQVTSLFSPYLTELMQFSLPWWYLWHPATLSKISHFMWVVSVEHYFFPMETEARICVHGPL